METGLQQILRAPAKWLGSKHAKVGLITNHTAVNPSFQHIIDLFSQHPEIDLRHLFAPEHGLRGTAQDMCAVKDARDPRTGLPITSLYGENFASLTPRLELLKDLDVLVFDIQDIGVRYYTYAATLALCMQVAGKLGLRVVVLDRPNPLGGLQIEGGGLQPGLESFVGLYPVPQRHALTVGELATLYQRYFGLNCELIVVPLTGWQRQQYFEETGLPWVLTSPNMPTLETAVVYAGMCLLEATNLSEARGTTHPFTLFGAPFIVSHQLVEELTALQLPGVIFRGCDFMPTFHKFAGEVCSGAEIHVVERRLFNSYNTGLAILHTVKRLWPQDFRWREHTYEFRDDVPAIDLLTGEPLIREKIDALGSLESIWELANARSGLTTYYQGRESILLY